MHTALFYGVVDLFIELPTHSTISNSITDGIIFIQALDMLFSSDTVKSYHQKYL